MWVVVMFDLPVVEKAERKAATDFRNSLLDLGFEMAQQYLLQHVLEEVYLPVSLDQHAHRCAESLVLR